MTAKEYLREIRELDSEVNAANDAIEKLKSKLMCAQSTTISDMPKGGKSETLEDGIAKLIDLQSEWADRVDEFVDRKRRAIKLIDRLRDPRHRLVLKEYYIYRKTFEKIAVDHERDYRTICRWHGSALQEFEQLHKSFLQMS